MNHPYEELLYRSRQIRLLHTLQGHNNDVESVAFSPDGRLLASGSDDETIKLWEAASGQEVRTLQGHTGLVWGVAFSPDGRLLASGSSDNTVRLWETVSGRVVRTLRGHSGDVNSVTFSPDGQLLAFGSDDETVKLWEAASGQLLRTLRGHTGRIWGVAFSPDGLLLASASDDQTVRLWEAASGQLLRTLRGHTHSAWGVAFSPDGRLLASSSADNTVRLWETASGQLLRTLQGHTDLVRGVAFSPDGRLLASGSWDNTVRLWETASGQPLRTLQGHTEVARSVAFSSDGRLLASGSWDNTVRLWDIAVLEVSPKPEAKLYFVGLDLAQIQTPLRHHLRTLPLCHVTAPTLTPARPAGWLRGAAAAGWPLPLALAHDLGSLLTQAANQVTIAKPAHLPFDEDTAAYLAFLQRFAAYPLVRQLPLWRPPLSDAVLSVVLARLVEGLHLPEIYRPPTGPEGVRFVRALAARLESADAAQLWRQTPLDQRPSWPKLLDANALARVERNLRALDGEELHFLARYGTPLGGTPDPRDLLDMLALTGLPGAARLALCQTLRLLPLVSEVRTVGGVQTYPEGGYEGLARKGSLDSLLPTELAYPQELFLHRVLNSEALYYGRERPRERRRELVYLVMQVGYGLGGDGQVLARALLLALAQALRRRGYEVLYSFAGAELSQPRPLDKPGDVGRVLYYYEPVLVDGEKTLRGVLRALRDWREEYRGRQVVWVLGEYFDADAAEEHAALYQALRAEGGQQAWYVRLGGNGRRPLPVTARYFAHWQVVETALLWGEGRG